LASADDIGRWRSLAIDPIVGESSRDGLAATIKALVGVSGSLRQYGNFDASPRLVARRDNDVRQRRRSAAGSGKGNLFRAT